MKSKIKYLLLYSFDLILCTILFIVLCRYIQYGLFNILFYRGCFFILICAIISMLFLHIGKNILKLEINWKDYIAVCSIFIGLTITWFTVGPVTVERSISVYMLSYMDQNDDAPVDIDDIWDAFDKQYIEKFGAFDKRFNEQISSGNVVKTDKGYVISPRGRIIVKVFRLLANVFDTEKWLVYPNNYLNEY